MARGPDEVQASLLRELRLYGGARGIWVDKATTGPSTGDGNGVTVSLLASEQGPYPDDLSAGEYVYPETLTPGWDAASISATKEAHRLDLPVFLIRRWTGGGGLRSVRLVRIVGWNDDERHFLLEPYRVAEPPGARQVPPTWVKKGAP